MGSQKQAASSSTSTLVQRPTQESLSVPATVGDGVGLLVVGAAAEEGAAVALTLEVGAAVVGASVPMQTGWKSGQQSPSAVQKTSQKHESSTVPVWKHLSSHDPWVGASVGEALGASLGAEVGFVGEPVGASLGA